ncbi:MAG: NAD(P)(+) transhydrogenase (Re/Si-specific) subunit beta, partial [Planctomycetota bacterium]|nr:NAD(P)(+) transhydrogenase (Re/Si-specific) subunit beta [Planctomycetota bacterium]
MWIPFGYLIAAVLFILGLKKLSHPRTAPLGNRLSSLGMAVAIGTALVQMEFGAGPITNWNLILLPMGAGAFIGLVLACKAKTTSMPELVALFNGFGGAASALVASAECWKFVEASELALPDPFTKAVAFGAAGFSAIIGWCTLTGSLLAVLKLLGGVSIFGKWWAAPTWGPVWLNVVKVLLVALVVVLTVALVNDPRDARWPILLLASSSVLGVLLVLPIGGADMPVVVSLLNSLSGIAAAFTGFIINNPLLLVAGSLVGAS